MIVTSASPTTLEQIVAQLDRLVPVHKVRDLTAEGAHVERELALVKVAGEGDRRVEALRLSDAFRARVIDVAVDSVIIEATGNSAKLKAFLEVMDSFGIRELARSGSVALSRGSKTMAKSE